MSFILGGEFDSDKTAVGRIAEFNLWNYAIPDRKINIETCGAVGRVVSWYTLDEYRPKVRRTVNLTGTCKKGRKPGAQIAKLTK